MNYFEGRDPGQWRTGVATYAKVRYENIHPGIDLVYYGNQGQLEYDFVVSPGGGPETIALSFQGADDLSPTATGTPSSAPETAESFCARLLTYQEFQSRRQRAWKAATRCSRQPRRLIDGLGGATMPTVQLERDARHNLGRSSSTRC